MTTIGKVQLWRVSDGAPHEAWPVDARGMIACGEFTDVRPEGAADPVTPSEAAPVPPAAPLTLPGLPGDNVADASPPPGSAETATPSGGVTDPVSTTPPADA